MPLASAFSCECTYPTRSTTYWDDRADAKLIVRRHRPSSFRKPAEVPSKMAFSGALEKKRG